MKDLTCGEIIQHLRREKKWSYQKIVDQLAKKDVKRTLQSLHWLAKGRTKNPRQPVVEALQEIYKEVFDESKDSNGERGPDIQ